MEAMKAPPIIYERKGRRISVTLVARVLHAGSRQAVAAITDISFYGLRMTCRRAHFERGEYISVCLPRYGLVRAKVAWFKDGEMGAMFTRPIDIRTFLLERKQQDPKEARTTRRSQVLRFLAGPKARR
jgi:hypothetical protein